MRAHRIARFVAALLTLAGSARAEDPELGRARALFDEAGELERRGQWSAAQERLRAALRIRETPHLHYALGWALERDGQLAAARAEYITATRLGEDTKATEVLELARARLAVLDRQREPGDEKTDPGDAAPIVQRPPGDASPRDVSPGRHTRGGSALPWVLVGTGGALVVSSAVLFVASSSDASARDDATARWCVATACSGGAVATRPETPEATALRQEANDAAARGNTKQVVGAILGGVGVIGAVVGTYFLVQASDQPKRPRFDAAVLPGGAAFSSTVSF